MEYLKKIFIIYANAGAGHRRAAEALYQVAQEQFPGDDIRIFDVLDYAVPVFKKTYPQTYLFMVKYCPWLWAVFYYVLNLRFLEPIIRIFRRTTNIKYCRNFEEYMAAEQPEVVITTHFLPNEIISRMKKAGKIRPFLATCITDYYPHTFWRDSGIDWYFIPNNDLLPRLKRLGIPLQRIREVGIPIMPAFGMTTDAADIRRKLGLSDSFTVLITSGGYGVGPVEDLVAQFRRVKTAIQVLVICGNNQKLQAELEELTTGSHHQFRIFGYVDNMYELMSISDVMISKAGGLTTTEAMAKQLPLIVLYPIPGQETNNCEFLETHQASLRAYSPRKARQFVEMMLDKPEKLALLKANISKLGRPRAAQDMIAFIKGTISGTGGR